MREGLRPVRVFSEEFKRKVVRDIEGGKVRVSDVRREYEVSYNSIYRWLHKYSRHLQSSPKVVFEMDSESYKSKELEKRIKELEAALGRKQMEVDFLSKMIELTEKDLGIEIKKKDVTGPLSGSGPIKGNTDTK